MRIFAFVVPFALLGCDVAQEVASTAVQLTTPAEFAPLLGKRLELNPSDFLTLNADGSLIGEFSGADTRGTWSIKDGFFCRVLTAGPRGPSPEDCQIFVQDGDLLNITRDKGRGSSFVYEIV